MDLSEIKTKLDERLAKQFSPRVLLDNMRFIDEASRKTSAYTDPLYIPFYYHLGHLIEPKNILDIGFRLGLFSACFLKSCKTVGRVLGFQEKTDEYYSSRLGMANVLQNARRIQLHVHVGGMDDDDFLEIMKKFAENGVDLSIINEETGYDKHRAYLDFVWKYAAHGGLIVVDYITKHEPARRALDDFCRGNNRVPITFATKYGTAIIEK